MTDKDDIIAKAALAQFAKFGLRKTTMQDVATVAGVSRQTLYNRVPNKDELLRLVAKFYFTDNISRCQEGLKNCKDLSACWDVVITHFVIEVWQTMNAMPEAEEFEMSAHEVIAKEIEIATNEKIALIAGMISRFEDAAALNNDKPEDIGRFFCATAQGIKTSAHDESALNALAKTLKQSLLTLTAPHAFQNAS